MGEHKIKMDAKKKKTTTKTKKQKKPTPNLNRPSWFDVPLKKGPTVLRNLSGIGGVTKSWRTATSPSCARAHPRMPHLIEINISPTPTTPCRKVISSQNDDGFGHYYSRMQLYRRSGQGIYFKGYSHQNLVVLDADLSHCYSHSGGLFFLPNWDCTVPFKLATSSSYGDDVMVITGVSSPAFGFFSKKKKHAWTMENCRAIEPYSTGDQKNKYMEFTNAIGSGGKYYAISLQGTLAVIQNEEIVALGKNRAVPWSKGARRFREHLVEYNEEIYLVFLISRKSINVVDDVEVLRLEVSNGYSWEKVESLPGDAMFFVGDKCCMGISASLVGCGGKFVYFTHDRVVRDGGDNNNKWFVYDMGKRCIFPTRGPEVDLTESHTPGLFVSAMDYY